MTPEIDAGPALAPVSGDASDAAPGAAPAEPLAASLDFMAAAGLTAGFLGLVLLTLAMLLVLLRRCAATADPYDSLAWRRLREGEARSEAISRAVRHFRSVRRPVTVRVFG
jgi:hypothetical protein